MSIAVRRGLLAVTAGALLLGLLPAHGFGQEAETPAPTPAEQPPDEEPAGEESAPQQQPDAPLAEPLEAPAEPLEAPAEPPQDGETELLDTETFQAQAAAADDIKITGLSLPTSFEVLPSGRIYVAEKNGVIKTFTSINGGGGQVVANITSKVSTFGDWGLTGLAYHNGFLYGSYTVNDPLTTVNCSGNPGGRPNSQVTGCPVSGRVSRWSVNESTGALGAEQTVLDGRDRFCFQFTSHGMDDLEVGPDGLIYASIGEGANFNLADWGQWGANPCNDPAFAGGALRSQTDNDLDGKIFRFNPSNPAGTIQVLAKGLRNPFRITFMNGELFTSDTGWVSFEEINKVSLTGGVDNFGWPCYEGNGQQPDYRSANLSICNQLYASEVHKRPIYTYAHGGGAGRASISALGAGNGLLYYADYTRGIIAALNPDGSGNTLVRTNVRVPEIKQIPYGASSGAIAYLDIVAGHLVILGDGPTPPPPPPPVSTAAVTIQAPDYRPGETVNFRVDHDFRADVTYSWTLMLLTNCAAPGPSCTRTPVPFTGQGQQVGSFTGPSAPFPAWVEASATVTSPIGDSASDTKRIARAVSAPTPGVDVSTAPIMPRHSGLVFDIEKGSTARGARLIQWRAKGVSNQRFRLEPLGDGTYRIVAGHSGMVLDVEKASLAPGARVVQWPWTGAANQRFRLESADGVWSLVAVHSGLALDVRGASTAQGAEIIQWNWKGGSNQKFRAFVRGAPISPRSSSHVLDVFGASTEPRAKVVQWSPNGGDNQRFRLEPLADGTYRVVVEHSGLVLDVEKASRSAGARIIQYPWTGADNQRFRVQPTGTGDWWLVAKHSGLFLDVRKASTTRGAEIIQWSFNGNPNQRWRF